MTIDIAKGKYWDEGITLIDGCTPCSPGCDHCWALAMEKRFSGTKTIGKGVWLHPERLKRFNTRKPKVFSVWNDLFHEDVKTRFIAEAIEAMQINKNNTFLVLTKRPERLAKFSHNCGLLPMNNVFWGITVCNQQEADEKIPIFLQVPGKKFLSIEPMLGPIDLRTLNTRPFPPYGFQSDNALQSPCQIDAVILGGETGPSARPMHPDWVRSIQDQCESSNTPFFFKSWGAWKGSKDFIGGKSVPGSERIGRLLDGRTHDELPWVTP